LATNEENEMIVEAIMMLDNLKLSEKSLEKPP